MCTRCDNDVTAGTSPGRVMLCVLPLDEKRRTWTNAENTEALSATIFLNK